MKGGKGNEGQGRGENKSRKACYITLTQVSYLLNNLHTDPHPMLIY